MKTDKLAEALNKSGLVEIVESSEVKRTSSYLLRLKPKKESEWLQVVSRLLQIELKESEDLHICRRYMNRNNRMVYGWHISTTSLKSSDLVNKLIIELLRIPSSEASVSSLKNQKKPVPVKKDPYQLRTILKTTDSDGKQVEVQEMRLPWVRGNDMNAPSRPVWSQEHGRMVGGGRGVKGAK